LYKTINYTTINVLPDDGPVRSEICSRLLYSLCRGLWNQGLRKPFVTSRQNRLNT